MKIRILTLIFLKINLALLSQNTNSKICYEIKYLDFFGLENEEVVKWSKSELNGLMKLDFEKDRNGSPIRTNFIIPLIAYQLKEYHPNCKTHIDSIYFDKISELYLKIRDINSAKLLNMSIAEKIDFIRADFYSQVENVNYLPKMIITFDDGPFYGVDFNQEPELKPLKTQETKFGTLVVSKADDKTILASKDKRGNIIWQKAITGLLGRNLTELHFTDSPIEYNSVATVVHMNSEGERFTLYLKSDGSFMYYFHSW